MTEQLGFLKKNKNFRFSLTSWIVFSYKTMKVLQNRQMLQNFGSMQINMFLFPKNVFSTLIEKLFHWKSENFYCRKN